MSAGLSSDLPPGAPMDPTGPQDLTGSQDPTGLMHPTSSSRPSPVLPIVAILWRAPYPEDLEPALVPLFGEPILRSGAWPFDDTRYYEPEMGSGLSRSFLAFQERFPHEIGEWKRATGWLEQRWRGPSGRRVNLDPGYISLGGLFLASTKPGLHRICLPDGIHVEITLFYSLGAWQRLPWTFPDFRSDRYHGFLTSCRERLKEGLRADVRSTGDRPR